MVVGSWGESVRGADSRLGQCQSLWQLSLQVLLFVLLGWPLEPVTVLAHLLHVRLLFSQLKPFLPFQPWVLWPFWDYFLRQLTASIHPPNRHFLHSSFVPGPVLSAMDLEIHKVQVLSSGSARLHGPDVASCKKESLWTQVYDILPCKREEQISDHIKNGWHQLSHLETYPCIFLRNK